MSELRWFGIGGAETESLQIGRESLKIMDRKLFASFLAAFVICFASMVGLYIVIDLFSNADEFLEDHAGTVAFVRRASKYYFIHAFEYYNRLAPVITMVAAMVTLATLHRHNELVALLAAGIPTRRAIVPVLCGALLIIGISVLNREFVLPAYSDTLQLAHESIEADVVHFPQIQMDRDQNLFKAESAYREGRFMENVDITLALETAGQLQEVHAPLAYYELFVDDGAAPPVAPELIGAMGWRLERPSTIQMARDSGKIRFLKNGDVFLFSDLSFNDMIRRHNWLNYAATSELVSELQNERTKDPQVVRATIHNRLMQPVLNLLLVLIGVPFVLQWERKDMYRSIFISMLLCGCFFAVDTTASYFAAHGHLDPMFAAWVPVFIFGPLSIALFDRIGT